MKDNLAEETEKTIRARNKLQKRLGMLDKKVTEEALGKKADEIERWISKHENSRVVLKEKSISLFDGNKNTAKMSVKLQKIADSIDNQ